MQRRICRKCSVELPASRYFNCIKCVPKLDDSAETFYETEEFDEHLVDMVDGLDDLDLEGEEETG